MAAARWQQAKHPDLPILAFFVFLAFFVLRFSLLLCAFLHSHPRFSRVLQRGKSSLFLGDPRFFFAKEARIEGSGHSCKRQPGQRKRGQRKGATSKTSKIVQKSVKAVRLQSEFCTKDLCSSYEFSYEKCSEIFPEIFEPLFCGSEKSHKIPAKFPTKFPKFRCEKSQKITDELLQERREKKMSNIFLTLFDDFRAAPVFRPLLGGALINGGRDL